MIYRVIILVLSLAVVRVTASIKDRACKFTLEEYNFDLTSLDKINPDNQYEVGNVHWKFCSHLWFADAFAYVDKTNLFSSQGYKLITSSEYTPSEVSLVTEEHPANYTGLETEKVVGIKVRRDSGIEC